MNFISSANFDELLVCKEDAVYLKSPTKLPLASSFLWNVSSMLQINCRGFATAQFLQPEPAKYSHAPNLEATTFMQPEQPYYSHHPGRFFYIKDLDNNELFSAPYEPVKKPLDKFEFIVKTDKICWHIVKDSISIAIEVQLDADNPCELWSLAIKNHDTQDRRLSITPYFSVGYMSWMNQSARYSKKLNAIVAHSVSPYQKVKEYDERKHFKDLTFLICSETPNSWEARQSAFEGEGGLHNPDALKKSSLSNSNADYETPTAAVQYECRLKAKESKEYRFAFGPAQNIQEVKKIRTRLFLNRQGFDKARSTYSDQIKNIPKNLRLTSTDRKLDYFVNHWLNRQVYYHGDVNRLSTDPQTRNFLQDAMGMTYLNPKIARSAFVTALSQQLSSGAMPDGILIDTNAKLKYINEVPHMDHCVWLPICLQAYLDETNDYEFLDEKIGFSDSQELATVYEHICRSMDWLANQRNEQGLVFIGEGDWCDPMNMVGHKGRGVSTWLTLAFAYSCQIWLEICDYLGQIKHAKDFFSLAENCNAAVNKHTWNGKWYGRGITDDGKLFGIKKDKEGKIFLNPQSWAMLSGACNKAQEKLIIESIESNLETPYGVQLLAPAFTEMREDIGRVTQKFPGSAENGSIYNHAVAFYIYALYQKGHNDKAFDLLRRMLPASTKCDCIQRGQLPVFIPNYYRGDYDRLPRTAGRSSQLFNTGSVHWIYRCLTEDLFGLKGCPKGLIINPKIPSHWQHANAKRLFRGATIELSIRREGINSITVNGEHLSKNILESPQAGKTYQVQVRL